MTNQSLTEQRPQPTPTHDGCRQLPQGQQQTPLCGLLVVDKPIGPSSMDVIRVVRRRARGAKTGHAGTLDPLASGVLVVCIGRATKQIGRIVDTSKRYRAVIDLRAFSATDDAEGELRPVEVARPPDRDAVESAVAHFVGEIMQRPPIFSAMKVGGRRAYKLARQGKTLDMKPRPVVIHSINIADYAWPVLTVEVHCGKGTYIRSLARDLGEVLGTGGYLTALQRTAVGRFTIDQAIALDAVPDPLTQSDLMMPIPDSLTD